MYTNVCLNIFQQGYVFPLSSVEVKIIFFVCVRIYVTVTFLLTDSLEQSFLRSYKYHSNQLI